MTKWTVTIVHVLHEMKVYRPRDAKPSNGTSQDLSEPMPQRSRVRFQHTGCSSPSAGLNTCATHVVLVNSDITFLTPQVNISCTKVTHTKCCCNNKLYYY